MESYIPISFLNDFIFCPRSIYFHQLYQNFDKSIYQDQPQQKGLIAHKAIDQRSYSTRKTIFQSLEIYSERYGLFGKIDIFDQEKNQLIERKREIKTIYDGYIFQLYAQYHCLIEMGYRVLKIGFYDMSHNKTYPIKLPEEDSEMQNKFECLLDELKNFSFNSDYQPNEKKCRHCIYHELCDLSLC